MSASEVLAIPPTPVNLAATSPVPGTVDVTWNDVAGETGFEVGWGPSSITAWVPVPADTTSYTFTGLGTGISYHFTIRACDPACSPSAPVVGKTPNGSDGLPAVPGNVLAASPVVGTVVLSWNDDGNETSYEVGWGPSAITTFFTVQANKTSHTFTGLNSGTSYHFNVRACNSGGCSERSIVIGRTPNGPICSITQNANHSAGTTTLSYVTYSPDVPSTFKVWVVVHFGAFESFTYPLPPLTANTNIGPFVFPLPPLGKVGFLSTLLTPTGGLLCSDFDIIDTATP